MARMQNSKLTFAMLLPFCLIPMPNRFVLSNMCTRGADYMHCHEVVVVSDNDAAVQQQFKSVFTVHECRDICDIDGCIAFEYQVIATERQQTCKLLWGAPEDIVIAENFSRCNEEEWLFSWKRPVEKTKGSCRVIEDEFETNEAHVSEVNDTNTTATANATAATNTTENVDEIQDGGANQTQVSIGSSGTSSRRRRRRRRYYWQSRRRYVTRRRWIYWRRTIS